MVDRFHRYRGAKVLVLGAAGFVGRWVSRALAASGADVVAVVRPATATSAHRRLLEGCRIAECDLERLDHLVALVQREQPVSAFNLAAYGVDPRERSDEIAFRINTRLVGALCEAMARCPARGWTAARVVHTGSALEYGTAGGDLHEDTFGQPTTIYGRSKLAGTVALMRACRKTSLKAVTARLFTVYGPGEPPGRLLPMLLAAAGTSSAINLTAGCQGRDFTYVGDVVEGLLRLGIADARPGAIVNLATGRLTSVRSFVETASAVLGIARARLQFGALPTRAEEMCHDSVTVERLLRTTGWRPVTSVAEGVALTANHAGARRPELQDRVVRAG